MRLLLHLHNLLSVTQAEVEVRSLGKRRRLGGWVEKVRKVEEEVEMQEEKVMEQEVERMWRRR